MPRKAIYNSVEDAREGRPSTPAPELTPVFRLSRPAQAPSEQDFEEARKFVLTIAQDLVRSYN